MKAGWKTVKLEEVCAVEFGERVVRKNDAGTIYPVYGGGGATFNIDRHNRESCVVVSRFGMSERCVRFVEGKFFLNDSGLTVTSTSPEASQGYIDLLLHAKAPEIYALGGGTAQKNLDTKSFRSLEIPLPPLAEQKRIVALLDEAFAGIDEAKAKAGEGLRLAHDSFKAQLQSAFTKRGPGWVDRTLEEVSSTFGRGKSKHRPRNAPHLYGGKYPFVQTGDIRSANHTITEYSQTYSDAGLAQSKLWPKGTICITIAANIAETAILDFDACFPDSVIGVVADPKIADVGYIEYVLQSLKARLQSLGKGSAQANINMATFENERFPFPPVAEQRKMVSLLDAISAHVHELASIFEAKEAAFDELKSSLLTKAFAGELTA